MKLNLLLSKMCHVTSVDVAITGDGLQPTDVGEDNELADKRHPRMFHC